MKRKIPALPKNYFSCFCGFKGKFIYNPIPAQSYFFDRYGEKHILLSWNDYPAYKCPECGKLRFNEAVENSLIQKGQQLEIGQIANNKSVKEFRA